METRDVKAWFIAINLSIYKKDGFWLVPSQTTAGRKYQVDLGGEGTCTCTDHADGSVC
jgi:hypothetical protein